jgi:hypothetical protein
VTTGLQSLLGLGYLDFGVMRLCQHLHQAGAQRKFACCVTAPRAERLLQSLPQATRTTGSVLCLVLCAVQQDGPVGLLHTGQYGREALGPSGDQMRPRTGRTTAAMLTISRFGRHLQQPGCPCCGLLVAARDAL